MTLLNAINELERRCLTKESGLTSAKELRQNGFWEAKRYFNWLRAQAPLTATCIPPFHKLKCHPR